MNVRPYDGCTHGRKLRSGRKISWWRVVKSKKLADQNIYLFRCRNCTAIKRKLIVYVNGKYGLDIKVTSKILKTEREGEIDITALVRDVTPKSVRVIAQAGAVIHADTAAGADGSPERVDDGGENQSA